MEFTLALEFTFSSQLTIKHYMFYFFSNSSLIKSIKAIISAIVL